MVTRSMPQTRQDHASFIYRSAILDQNESFGPSASMGADVTSMDVRASVCSADSFPLNRRDSMKWLSQAASTLELTNDLKYRRKSESVKGFAPSVYSTVDVDDDVERPRDSEISISVKPISNHQRNAGKYTVVAFVNSASGGGMGKTLLACLQAHLGPSFVIDLHSCRPGSMPEDILLKYAYDPMVRVLVCGGDGTCGWIASCLDKVWLSVLRDNQGHLHLSKYKDHLPLAIMPLGTGNDLSRQFGWGGTFQPHMKKRTMITSVEWSKLTHLDTWRCIVLPMQKLEDEEKQLIPKILGESNVTERMEQCDSLGDSLVRQTTAGLLQSLLEDDAPYEFSKSSRRKNTATASEALTQIFDGSFCNYFSLGFDATMAYHFHHDREEHPEKFSSSLKNKIAYIQKSPHALRAPKLRKRVKVLVNNEEGQLVELKVPKNCRAIIVMNIQSYAAGHHLASKGSPEDALVEVIFVSNLFRAATAVLSPIMPLLFFKVAAQTNNVCLRTRCPLHCQVDGEPWIQGEGVINIKFHSRKAMLEKVNDRMSCGCMGTVIEDTVIN